jgi:hypothetical protein
LRSGKVQAVFINNKFVNLTSPADFYVRSCIPASPRRIAQPPPFSLLQIDWLHVYPLNVQNGSQVWVSWHSRDDSFDSTQNMPLRVVVDGGALRAVTRPRLDRCSLNKW